MIEFTEGNLQIKLPGALKAKKFDDKSRHGLSHCMKAVDFIVELPDRLLFIEFKDPDNPSSKPERRDKFVNKFKSGELDKDLKEKYRDSFLYEWASGNIEKPVHYLVLVAIANLTDKELLDRTQALKRNLPVKGPLAGVWKRQIVAECGVFNIATWNSHLKYTVTRISSQ